MNHNQTVRKFYNHINLIIVSIYCVSSSLADETKQAWLGVVTAKVEPILANQLDLPEGTGAAVKLVIPDSPASKSGIKKHDIIFEFNGSQITSPSTLSQLISKQQSGDIAELAIIQKGSKKTIEVNLAERPDYLEATEEKGNNLFKDQFDFGELGGINFDILPFGNDQKLDQQIKEMQEQMRKNLQGMFDLQGFDNLPGIGQLFGSSSQKMIYRDDEGTIEIQKSDGKTTITTKDLNGKKIFEGPANTTEQINKLPNRAKIQLKKLNESGLSFEGFNFESPGLKIPKLKPGKKVAPIPPAKKDGKKIQL